MIGFQEYIINNKINITKLAKEIGINASSIHNWLKNKRVPERHLKFLSNKFSIDIDYINKQVNNIDTYKNRKKVFEGYKINEDHVILYFTRKNGSKHESYVDIEDLDRMLNYPYSWHPAWHIEAKAFYVRCHRYLGIINNKCKYESYYLHDFIMNTPNGMKVDYINHNTMDNRKSNLRSIPHIDNVKNRKGKNSNNKSGYRNVSWCNDEERWLVQLQINKKNTVLGRFKYDELDKAGAFAEEMRQKYYGEFAGLN